MDPLYETKVGLWNRSHVVLIGHCEQLGDRWRVRRAMIEQDVWVEVAAADVIGGPEPLDYPPSGYDNEAVQGLKVRSGATASVRVWQYKWKGALETRPHIATTLCQSTGGGTLCVSNLLFDTKPHWLFPWIKGFRFIGFCFGKWNPETAAPPP